MPRQLTDIAKRVRRIIERCDALEHNAAWHGLDDSNVIGVLDYWLPMDISESDMRTALVVAGYSERFPRAIRGE